jgi:hypothetical protein
MSTWRVAKSLEVLLSQWNAAHPDRSKASDGSIGDAAHAARTSDHNPWVGPASDGKMIVTARDFTHDPAHGADADQLAAALVASRDPRIKYVIRNRRMCRSYPKTLDDGTHYPAWSWAPYDGDNPHTKHVHVSVASVESLYDRTTQWKLSTSPAGGTTGNPPKEEISMADAASIERAIAELKKDIYAGPRYSALQNSINAVGRAVAAIVPYLNSQDVANDAALQKAVAELKAELDKPEPDADA